MKRNQTLVYTVTFITEVGLKYLSVLVHITKFNTGRCTAMVYRAWLTRVLD